MQTLSKIINTGVIHATGNNHKRDVRIINYFSLILVLGLLLLIITRSLIAIAVPGSNVVVEENVDFVGASFIALLPFVCNYFGRLRLARLLVSWMPPVVIIGLYSIHASRNSGVLLTSEFNSIYLFLLSAAAVPYLLRVYDKQDFIASLILPTVFIVFCDVILSLLGVTYLKNQGPGPVDGIEIYRMRALIACFFLNGCCFVIKKLIDKQDAVNESLIKQLEEQNILIDQQATEKISESKNRFRLLFEQATDAIFLFAETKKVEMVNASACKIFGYTENEFLSLSLDCIWMENDKKELAKYDGTIVELMLKKKDGTLFPVEASVKHLPGGGYQAFIRDISSRKEAERKIKEAEERFRALVEKSLAGVYIVQDDKFTYVNPQFASIFGYSQAELENSPVDIVMPSKNLDTVHLNIKKQMGKGRRQYIYNEVIGKTKDGQILNVELLGCLTPINEKSAIIGTLIDVTEKRSLQKKVSEQKEQEQRKIIRAIIKAEEKERSRLGRELHDNISQILGSVSLYLSMAASDETGTKHHILSSKELIKNAIDEVRALSHQMVTPLKEIKLQDLIAKAVEKISMLSSIKTSVNYDIRCYDLKDDLKLNLYRIIQEQVNNTLKYAKASNVNIELKCDKEFLTMLIKDDGKGFDMTQKRNGIGLTNILNRVESFNGEMKLTSSPGNGCQLIIKIPAYNLETDIINMPMLSSQMTAS